MLRECPLGTMQRALNVCHIRPYRTREPPEPDGLADFAIAEDLDEPADIQAGVDTQAVELPTTEDTLQPTVGVGSPCLKGADCGEGWACSSARRPLPPRLLRNVVPHGFRVQRYPGGMWLLAIVRE